MELRQIGGIGAPLTFDSHLASAFDCPSHLPLFSGQCEQETHIRKISSIGPIGSWPNCPGMVRSIPV